MKIAIIGPIATSGVIPFLDTAPPEDFPYGYLGAPFMNTLIAQLLQNGHNVCAITAGGYPARRESQPRSLSGAGFKFYCCPSRRHSIRPSAGRMGRILDFFAYERDHIQNVLNEFQPDVVHAHWTYEFAMAAITSGRPYLVTAHDDPVEVLKLTKNIYRFGRYLMARRVLQRANALTAVSFDLANRITRLSRANIKVIPNPLDQRFIDAGRQNCDQNDRSRCVIISVINGWSFLKNNKSALTAFGLIRRQFPNAEYHLYGMDNEAGGPAERWARSNDLAGGVKFFGPVPHGDLIEALQNATLMLHPSKSESCPMGIAEALAHGLPVVGGYKSGGVPEMIRDAGVLVDIDKPTAIAGGVSKLLNDHDLYRRSSRAALKRIATFAPESVVLQYERIYRNLVNEVSS
jgi:glycosyltransferase involved in cell wall biosynthesis